MREKEIFLIQAVYFADINFLTSETDTSTLEGLELSLGAELLETT